MAVKIPQEYADMIDTLETIRLKVGTNEGVYNNERVNDLLWMLDGLTYFVLDVINKNDYVVNASGRRCTASVLRYLMFNLRGLMPWTRNDIEIEGLTVEKKLEMAQFSRKYYDILADDKIMNYLLSTWQEDHLSILVVFAAAYKYKADNKYDKSDFYRDKCLELFSLLKQIPEQDRKFNTMELGRFKVTGKTNYQDTQICTNKLLDAFINFELLMIDKDPKNKKDGEFDNRITEYKARCMADYMTSLFNGRDILDIAPYNFDLYTHLRFINLLVLSSAIISAVTSKQLNNWERVMSFYTLLFYWSKKRFGGNRPTEYFKVKINRAALRTIETIKQLTTQIMFNLLQTPGGYRDFNKILSDICEIGKEDYFLALLTTELERKMDKCIQVNNVSLLRYNLEFVQNDKVKQIIYNHIGER